MTTTARARYKGHRFPAEIIGHAVWLYFRFPLGLRMVEELLAARGIMVSHETVRQWARKFGQRFANQIRRRLRRGEAWVVASRRPDRRRARCFGPTPTRQAGCQAATAQAVEKADAAAPRHDHRQAGQLWGGPKGGHAR